MFPRKSGNLSIIAIKQSEMESPYNKYEIINKKQLNINNRKFV